MSIMSKKMKSCLKIKIMQLYAYVNSGINNFMLEHSFSNTF